VLGREVEGSIGISRTDEDEGRNRKKLLPDWNRRVEFHDMTAY
jgi:hypothetical protein